MPIILIVLVKIISDFWKWLSKISGKENTFADEETLKDFFQVSMDNPASRNIRVKIKEKHILHESLAEFLGVPEVNFKCHARANQCIFFSKSVYKKNIYFLIKILVTHLILK